MKIEILGTGCLKCKTLEEVVKNAVAKLGIFAQVEKVDDVVKIMEYGVVSTPGLVVNGEVALTGRVPSEEEILNILKDHK